MRKARIEILKRFKNEQGFTFYQKSSPSEAGFTLLEMLVVTVLLGLMVTVAATIIINILRNQNKTNTLIEIRQNAGLVVDTFERDVRAARDATLVGTTGVDLTLPDGSHIIWSCVAESGGNNGYFTRQVGSAVAVDITNRDNLNGTSVSSCTFGSNGELVSLTFNARQAVGSPNKVEFSVTDTTFATSVSPRSDI